MMYHLDEEQDCLLNLRARLWPVTWPGHLAVADSDIFAMPQPPTPHPNMLRCGDVVQDVLRLAFPGVLQQCFWCFIYDIGICAQNLKTFRFFLKFRERLKQYYCGNVM